MKLLDRPRRLLVSSTREWQAIDKEFTTAGSIYGKYAAPLAALGAGAAALVGVVTGRASTLFGTFELARTAAVGSAIVWFVTSLVYVFLVALAVDLFAPGFGGQRNAVQSVKAAAYSATPLWLGAWLGALPGLGFLGLLVALFWSLALLSRGARVVMRIPPDRSGPFGLLCGIAAAVVYLITTAVATAFV